MPLDKPLWRHNWNRCGRNTISATDGTTAVEGEYLEVRAIRA